jgi:DNA-binding GntR family transcriptional regulator
MLAQARALSERMRPGASPPSYTHFAEADAELHDLVAAGSGNRLIRETLSRMHLHFHIFRLRFHSNLITDSVAEHEALVAALIARDADAAEAAMRQHIERSYQRFSPVVA